MSVISFRFIVCLLLVFERKWSASSGMDDRQVCGTVTDLFQNVSGPGKQRKYFVTHGPSCLSSFLVWTGFALHG
jgi:hypothetical protein